MNAKPSLAQQGHKLSRSDFLRQASRLAAAGLLLPALPALANEGSVLRRPIPSSGEMIPVVGSGTAVIYDIEAQDPRIAVLAQSMSALIGGGGASLTVFDAVLRHGGRPANYCEIGGNPTEEKVAALTSLLLTKPGVRRLAVIMNVVNNTRADVMARGVIRGIEAAGRAPAEVLSVFRIPGSWEEEAAAHLASSGVKALGREVSLDAAAALAVQSLAEAAAC